MAKYSLDSKRFIQGTALLFVLSLFGKVIALVRDQVIAWTYGAGQTSDAFFLALTGPSLVFTALGQGLASGSLRPMAEAIGEGQASASRLAGQVVSFSALSMFCLAIGGVVANEQLIRMLAPGFSPEAFHLAVRMGWILFLGSAFMGLGLVLTGLLNSHGDFLVGAAAPLVGGVITVAVVYLGSDSLGPVALALATTSGFMVQTVILAPRLLRKGLNWNLDWQGNKSRVVLSQLGPALLAAGVGQCYPLVERYLASFLSSGKLTALTLASKVAQVPLGLFVSSIVTVAGPQLASAFARHDEREVRFHVASALRLVLMFAVPSAVGFILLRVPVTRLLFQRGNFSPTDAHHTAEALVFFSLTIVTGSLIQLLGRFCYAVGDAKTPLIANGVGVIGDFILGRMLLNRMDYLAIGMSAVFSTGVTAAIIVVSLAHRIDGFPLKRVLKDTVQILVATGAMTIVLVAGGRFLESRPSGDLLYVTGAVLVGAVCYLGTYTLIRWKTRSASRASAE